jgi:sec-independent protein translocase protein TatA
MTGGSVLGLLEGADLLIVLVLVVLLFGSSRLPKLARSLGQAKREFRNAVHEGEDDTTAGGKASDKPTT